MIRINFDNLQEDSEETQNAFRQNPEVASEAQKALFKELNRCEGRPLGEFTD